MNYMKKLMGLVALAIMVLAAPSWGASVIKDEKEWLQPNLFSNLSWDDINVACPNNGSPCAGSLNGTDVTGYIWATFPEIIALTALYGAPTPTASEVDSLWAPAFLADFEPTRTQVGTSEEVLGNSAEVSSNDVTGVSQLTNYYSPAGADRNWRVGGPRDLPLTHIGAYLYRPVVPHLTLVKTSNVSTYSAINDVINYSYLITVSMAPAVGPITVADDKETVTCPDVNTVGNNDDNLDPGESLTCTATRNVDQPDIDATFIINKASASSDAGATVSNEDVLTVKYQSIFKDGFEDQL